jgi:hypothetical protein
MEFAGSPGSYRRPLAGKDLMIQGTLEQEVRLIRPGAHTYRIYLADARTSGGPYRRVSNVIRGPVAPSVGASAGSGRRKDAPPSSPDGVAATRGPSPLGGFLLAATLGISPGATPASDDDRSPLDAGAKEVAGTAEVLRSVPKRFARLQHVDLARRRVGLLIEGEGLSKAWDLTPDAEVRRHGWWGRLDQLHVGDRHWVWFKSGRDGEPQAVLMIADELSEQAIHGPGLRLAKADGRRLTLKPLQGPERELRADEMDPGSGAGDAKAGEFRVGERVFVQSAGDRARLVLSPQAFEELRSRQRSALRDRWLQEGLPGTITFTHLSCEVELMLDHEAMRWGRSLKCGDRVTLQTVPPSRAVVKQVDVWRERTKVQLVVAGADLADMAIGQRTGLRMSAPDSPVEESDFPPDMDRPRTKQQRIDWFLASIYCTCKVRGDRCTGHFYTLASCNPNGCPAPREMRQALSEMLDRGLTDRQIFEELLKEHGTDLVRSHLLP